MDNQTSLPRRVRPGGENTPPDTPRTRILALLQRMSVIDADMVAGELVAAQPWRSRK